MPSNRERFLKLSKSRLENTKKQIELIGNLSDKSNYSYQKEEIEEIFAALQEKLNEERSKFNERDKSKLNTLRGI